MKSNLWVLGNTPGRHPGSHSCLHVSWASELHPYSPIASLVLLPFFLLLLSLNGESEIVSLSHVQLFVTPWTIAFQAPLSVGFSKQEYWSELPFLFLGDLSNPEIKPTSLSSPALAGEFFTCWEAQKWKCLVAQFCPTLCNPMDYSLLGSSVHRILWARVLEWVAIPFSRGSSQPKDKTQVSCIAGRFFTKWTPT